MNKKISIKKNYLYNLIYDVIVLIVPIITTPYISRVLAVDSIGIYSFTFSIVQYFTAFVVLGTRSYAIKQISRYNNKFELTYGFFNIFFLRFIFGIISLTIYYIYIYNFSDYFFISFLQSLYIISVIFDISWFFQGIENFKIIVTRNLFIKIISLIVIFSFVKNNDDLYIYVCSLSGLTLLANLSLWPCLHKYLCKIKFSKIQPFNGIKQIIILFIPTLALHISGSIDKTMLGIFTNGMIENGFYEQASKITYIILTISTSLSVVVLPRISYLYSRNEHKLITEYMENSYRFILLISFPLLFGMLAISDILVPWFLGESYLKCVSILNIFSVLFLIVSLSNATGLQYLIATDRQNLYSLSIIVGAIINCILNIFLIKSYASVGAALATDISELSILSIQLFYIVHIKKEFSIITIFGKAWKYLFCSVLVYLLVELIKFFIKNNNYMLIILISFFLSLIMYFLTLLLLKDELILNYINSYIIKKIKKL